MIYTINFEGKEKKKNIKCNCHLIKNNFSGEDSEEDCKRPASVA